MNPYDEMKAQWKQQATQTASVVQKGAQLARYLVDKYGREHAKFICSRLEPGLKTYDIESLESMGDKIAIFNGWL